MLPALYSIYGTRAYYTRSLSRIFARNRGSRNINTFIALSFPNSISSSA